MKGPLTLEDAIRYAKQYNLDLAVKKLERDILEEAVVGAKLKMLPALIANGELSWRDSYRASFSEPLFEELGGGQAFNYSSDKTTKEFRLELSWDLLEFGIAYYQQRQAFNRANIAEQRRRRVAQNLSFDVTRTFWQAQVSKAGMQIAEEQAYRLREREKILEKQLESGIVSEIDVLETAAALCEMKIRMTGFERELVKYKQELASLIGLTGRAGFEIADADFTTPIEQVDLDVQTLETTALGQRPELFEKDLEELITADEARIAVANLAPNPSVFWRYNYNDDTHLYYDDWQDVGFKISFDLFSILQKMSERREVLKRQELIRKRRLSMAAAIVTQIQIAVVDYHDRIRQYGENKQIMVKRRQLMEARRRHSERGNGRIEDVLKSEGKYLFSRVRTLQSFADTMIAHQRILNTIGADETGAISYLQ